MSECSKIKLTVIDTDKDYQILDIRILNDGLLDPSDLSKIALPDNLITTKGVVLCGKASIWLYAYLLHNLHHCLWLATFDPRRGAVVVQNHQPNGRKEGDIIPIDEIKPWLETLPKEEKKNKKTTNELNKLVVVIGGPPHSGKSVFIQALRIKLQQLNPESFSNNFYIIRACPDGEGDWFGEIPESEGKHLKTAGDFTDDFAEQMAIAIENAKKIKNIIIVDVGGRLDKKNNLIFSKCNSGIIVSNNKDSASEWKGAYDLTELKLLARINSVLNGQNELISTNPLEITLTDLCRDNIQNVIVPGELIKIFEEYL